MSLRLDVGACIVRSWRADDAPSLVRHANDRAIWLNLRDRFPHPYTAADAAWWVEHALAQQPQTDFAIDVAGEAVGGIGIILREDVERCSGEVGYWLGRTLWGRGITSVALRGFTGYCFGAYRLERIFAQVFAWNPASARVLEKAGYRLEAVMRRSAIKDGVVVDQLLYGITRDEAASVIRVAAAAGAAPAD
jgi:RimJ/RimL family protein N-acetyltransferase